MVKVEMVSRMYAPGESPSIVTPTNKPPRMPTKSA